VSSCAVLCLLARRMSAWRWHGDVAGCSAREVSEWAGHHSVAVTLTRYGGLFEDGSDAAIGRLDALLGSGVPTPGLPPSSATVALLYFAAVLGRWTVLTERNGVGL
jgi:hypothetical protein